MDGDRDKFARFERSHVKDKFQIFEKWLLDRQYWFPEVGAEGK
jgi:hypothetical protein